MRSDFLKKYIAKSVVITPGVDTTLFKPSDDQKHSNTKNILFVASLTRSEQYKGLKTLIAAAVELKKQAINFVVTVVGDGNMREEYQKNVESLGLQDNFIFKGKLSGVALAEEYQHADIFAHPTSIEGFGMVILEAMASKLPVVASNVGGIPLLIEDGENGFLIEPENPQQLAYKLFELLNNSTLSKTFAQKGYEKAIRAFSWEQRSAEYSELFKRTAIRKGKKKIAFLLDVVYPYSKGGRERRLDAIANKLAAEGHEVTIYSMKLWEGPDVIERDGVMLHAISPFYDIYVNNRRSVLKAIYFSLHCFNLLGKDFDIIDVDHIPHTVLFITKIVCVLKRKKMIVTWHEVWGAKYWKTYLGTFKGTLAYWIEKMSANLADGIISVSSHTTDALVEVLGVSKPITTIANGVELEIIKNTKPSKETSDILFAGRLLPHKNVDMLLRAVAIIKKTNPSIQLKVIGDGPQFDELKELSDSLGLQNNVSFPGFIEEDVELYGIMRASKVFVLPSSREGFGMSIIEANAAGLPVVTINSEHNAAKLLIVNDENGLVAESNPESLAAAIQDVLQTRKDSDFYARYSKKFDWPNIILQVESIYNGK